MIKARTADRQSLHVEEAGSGVPILFIHEFAGDHRAWEPQLARFSRSHRCITYAARGYPPSSVPTDPAAYSQELAIADAIAVLDQLEVERAHVVGLSMGGFVGIDLALAHPERLISLTAAAVGFGVDPEKRDLFHAEEGRFADAFEAAGAPEMAARIAQSPLHVAFAEKDPRGHAEWARRLGEHSGPGAANTIRGVQMQRPSLHDVAADLRAMRTPTLIVAGDDDVECVGPSVWLSTMIPASGLAILPRTGHTINLEEPELFNLLLAGFLERVAAGRWPAATHRLAPDVYSVVI